MRALLLLLLMTALGAGCGLLGRQAAPGDDAEPEERGATVPSGEALATHLRERLPGVKRLSLVKLLRWTEQTPGPCTADFAASEGAGRIDLDYETDEEKRSLHSAELSSLTASGWDPAYRAPSGVGFEKLAPFRSIDLTLRQTLECRCFGGSRPVASYPTVLRFRWNQGSLPEASAAIERGGKADGLRSAITAGRLVTYEFPISASFPPGQAGSCDAHLAVTVLVEPPIR